MADGLGLKREIAQVAKDKGIDAGEIIGALEEAMKQAARRERGLEIEIDAKFNPELGEVELFEFREVVEEATSAETEITLAAQKVMGAYGYASEFPMERYVRDSLALPIFGGSSAIQRNNIVNWLGLPR